MRALRAFTVIVLGLGVIAAACGSGGSSESQTAGSGWTLSLKTGLMPNHVWEYEWDGGYEEGGDTPDVSYSAYFDDDIAKLYASVTG